MGQQASFVSFTGNIGKLTFYKNKDGFMVREKGGVTKERIMNDPKYARTRENMREFAEAASAVKLLKNSIRPAIISSTDSRLHRRLQHAMVKVVKSDPVHTRGERKVTEGNWDLLKGLQLNAGANLTSVLKKHVVITNTGETLAISLPAFHPASYLMAPSGTTNYRIYLMGGAIDLELADFNLEKVESEMLSVRASSPELTLELNKAPLEFNHRVFVLGIEFFQTVNGEEFPMNDSGYNAGTIILTEKIVTP
ncbi:hypothetical protein KI659_16620 [Litoribacter alkaliphilus]|uniref:Uncharacterized protein n=1 Tax=Litoribacter ruber TaxID=702568 RepID=A0AAP2CL02_9BACT|nr:hypothetical protein [Litoribacter alkaliphilus]MBS9525644.1 hypothetical protein [Litoribacter alkaliphilus]